MAKATITERQQRFVTAYAVSLDATKAAKEAGYSARNPKQIGHKVLHRPVVQAALREYLSRQRQDAELSEGWVLDRLKRVVERCLQAEPVQAGADGAAVGEYRFDAAGANRALELLGKHLAMFTDNLKISELDQVPDDELDSRIAELERQARAAAVTH